MWGERAEAHMAHCNAEIVRIAGRNAGKIVCPVWGEDGVISAAVYFQREGTVVFKFPSQALTDQLFALWEACAAVSHQWRIIVIEIENGSFSIDVHYPHQVDDPVAALEPALMVRQFFSVNEWDDTDPEVDEPKPQARRWWRR